MGIVRPQRVGAHELRQPVSLVGGRAPLRLLLVKDDVDPCVREQERRLRPGQTAADDVDVALHPRRCYTATSALASSETPRSPAGSDRKSTRLNSSHSQISYAVFC